MLISVIVPIYYGKKYILNMVSMIQKNQNKLNDNYQIEIIFINDSPEEQIELNEYVKDTDCNVRLYNNKENSGIHYSRVNGLKYANGEYIVFLDQDDAITENYFASQLKLIGSADVVVANGISQYANYNKILYKYGIMQWTVKHIWFYTKFDCRIISPGQCLIKKESIPKEWKENIIKKNGSDDYYLWLLMLQYNCKFVINRDKLYTHVFTNNNTSLNIEGMEKSVEEVLYYLDGVIGKRHIDLIKKRIYSNGRKSILVKIVERMNKE